MEDQAALTFITGGAAQFTSTVSEGVITVTPDANWNGSGAVSLIATDPSGANATATFTLTVTPVPDAPIFVAQENTSVNEDEILTLTDQGISRLPLMMEQVLVINKPLP